MRLGFVAAVATLVVGLSVGFAGTAEADGGWVSVATSPDQDHVHWRWGYSSQAQVDAEALGDCWSSGGTYCEILVSATPCVAVLYDGEHMHYGYGPTRQAALAYALNLADPMTEQPPLAHCYWDPA